MAPRAFWKGYLKLSLVSCPVAMTPATTEAETLRFRTLNARTGHPVTSRYVDSITGKPVSEENEAKGYPRGENDFVLLEDEEIEAVGLESTRTIDIETFVPADSIGWIWLDRPHYLVPDDAVGAEAFAVIRHAMAVTKTVGISRIVLYRRERAVMLEPRDRGIVLWTLRYGDEVRSDAELFPPDAAKPDPALMKLVTRLIDERTKAWGLGMVDDPVQESLRELIASKSPRKHKTKTAPKHEPLPADNVVSIMDALRKSLSTETGKKGR